MAHGGCRAKAPPLAAWDPLNLDARFFSGWSAPKKSLFGNVYRHLTPVRSIPSRVLRRRAAALRRASHRTHSPTQHMIWTVRSRDLTSPFAAVGWVLSGVDIDSEIYMATFINIS